MKLLDILESWNTKFDLKWQTHNDSIIAYFNIEDEFYDIRIDEYSLTLPSRTNHWRVYEASFRRHINGAATIIQTESKYIGRVLGIVYNGILEKLNQDRPECVVFSAKYSNDSGDKSILSKRINIYQKISNKLTLTGLYANISPILSQYAHNFVLVRSDLNILESEINWIRNNV